MSTSTFGYTGAAQTFTVPATICGPLTITATGGAGGDWHLTHTINGGKPGQVIGTLNVVPGDVIKIEVGGPGKSITVATPTYGVTAGLAGAWPDGGKGGYCSATGWRQQAGASGGGSTRVYKNGTLVLVAGGGAGAAGGPADFDSTATGGDGGGNTGGMGNNTSSLGGAGGTQTAGGVAGVAYPSASGVTVDAQPGASLKGGAGSRVADTPPVSLFAGGGGGGGYYGGGGGSTRTDNSPNRGAGGGGGSSWTGGLTTTTSNTQGAASPSDDGSGQVLLSYNVAPNKPTLTTPADTGDIDVTAPALFEWVYSDPDASDSTQGHADWRWRVGGAAWTTVTNASTGADQSYTAAAGTFSAYVDTLLEWQVQTYDPHGNASGWSESSFFVPRNPPATPTVQATLSSATPPYEVTAAAAFRYAQVRLTADASGTAGTVLQTDTATFTDDQTDITGVMATTPGTLVTGTSYHMQARVAYYDGVWSPWADTGAIVANINAPDVPTLTAAVNTDTASVTLVITNPAGTYPAVSNDIFRTNLTDGTAEVRVASGVVPNGSWTDWQAPLNTQLRYRVVAYAASGSSSSSD